MSQRANNNNPDYSRDVIFNAKRFEFYGCTSAKMIRLSQSMKGI